MLSKAKTRNISITTSYVMYASPAKVFDALTKEGIIGEWCDGGGKVEPEIDGDVAMFGDWIKGKVVTYDQRNKKLSYTWKPSEWDKKTAPSLVEYTIKPHPAGSELTVVHSGFPSQEEADKHYNGWTDYVFEPLNDYFTQ
jgi:uncharacterized protein YndB with AHSA1/START domain